MARLCTESLSLEPCTTADAADFIALERDPEVMQYLHGGAVDHGTIDPGNAPFLMPRGTETYVWTARRAGSEAFVGWFCLYPMENGHAELGYRLRKDAWGQGFASEGARALVDWGFAAAGYRRIVAETMAVNLGSRRVMEKLGMRHVATEFPIYSNPLPGLELGEAIYEISREEWNCL